LKARFRALCWLLGIMSLSASADDTPLIVVQDRGGASALPYYQSMDLPPIGTPIALPEQGEVPTALNQPIREAEMLPVRSALLSPGKVERRPMDTTGLRPLFLVGDDELSRTWLRQRAASLRDLIAVGLVVNVESAEGLADLRDLAPGLTLSPVSGDDLAQRLEIRHYPVLITATGLEQ